MTVAVGPSPVGRGLVRSDTVQCGRPKLGRPVRCSRPRAGTVNQVQLLGWKVTLIIGHNNGCMGLSVGVSVGLAVGVAVGVVVGVAVSIGVREAPLWGFTTRKLKWKKLKVDQFTLLSHTTSCVAAPGVWLARHTLAPADQH